jgi:hypothetical protein
MMVTPSVISNCNWDMRSIKFFLLRTSERIESISFETKARHPNIAWNEHTCLQFHNAASNHGSLKILTLDSVLSNVDPSMVFHVIGTIATLVCLNLQNNNLRDKHMDYMLKSINIKMLKDLNLSNNRFGRKKIIELLNSFKEDNELRTLNLSSLGITDTIFGIITEKFLYKQSRLTTLVLNNNIVTSIGIDYAAGILSCNQLLLHLNLKNNCLTSDKSIHIITDILACNFHICTFDIENYILQDSDISPINKLLHRNCNLRLYQDAAMELARNDKRAISLALWPHVLCHVKCPDDLYDLLLTLVASLALWRDHK